MTTTTTYDFNNIGEYIYDGNLVEIVDGKAQLKLQSYPGRQFEETFTSDTGFVYDPTVLEFAGGVCRQVDKGDGALCFANFSSDENMTWSNGSDTNNLVGGTYDVVNENVVLDSSGEYLEITDSDNLNFSQTFYISFDYTPNYDNFPATTLISSQGSGDANEIDLSVLSNGNTRLRMYDSSGVLSIDVQLGRKDYDSGVTQRIELISDLTTGDTRLYIGGVQLGATQATTFTRTSTLSHLRFGGSSGNFRGTIDNIMMFPTVQTQGRSLVGDIRFLDGFLESPLYTADGSNDGNLLSIQSWNVTPSMSLTYVFMDAFSNAYWYDTNINAWGLSDKTPAQSNTPAELIQYLPQFPWTVGTNLWKFGTVFHAEDYQHSIDNIEVEYTHQIYTTTNPTIVPNNKFRTSEITSLSATTEIVGSDDIKYTVLSGEQDRWVTGGNAADSNGTYAESNTIEEISGDIGNLITIPVSSTAKVFLHSADGLTTPKIDILSIVYNQATTQPDITICNLDAYIYDHDGPAVNKLVKIRPYAGFVNSTALHIYEWQDLGTTNDTGWFSANIYIQTPGQYWELKVGKQSYKIQLPNSTEADFSTLTSFEVVNV
jgi:hypothetical protein